MDNNRKVAIEVTPEEAEEIADLAANHLIVAWEDQAVIPDPSELDIRENERGEIEFHYKVEDGFYGKCEITYSPQKFIESLIAVSNFDYMEYCKENISEAKQDIARTLIEKRISRITSIIVRNLLYSFSGLVYSQPELAVAIYDEAAKKMSASVTENRFTAGTVNEYLNTKKENIDFFIRDTLKGEYAPLELFCWFFDSWYPQWVEAKKFYTQVKRLKNPLDRVKQEFPKLFPDLIDQIALQGEQNSPKTLALISAARVARMPKPYSHETLATRLESSRNLRSNMTEEAFFYRLKWYLEFLKQENELDGVLRNAHNEQ